MTLETNTDENVNYEVVPPRTQPTPNFETPQPVESAPIEPKKSYKKLIMLAALVLVVLIVGAGVSAYAAGSPDRVIKKMVQQFGEARTYKYAVKMELALPQGEATLFEKMVMDIDGQVDSQDDKNMKATAKIKASVDSSGQQIFLEGETRALGDVYYFMLANISELPVEGFQDYIGKWYKFDSSALKKQLGITEQDAQLSDEDKQKLKQLQAAFSKYRIFEITDKLAGEKIDGEATRHYAYIVNKAELVKFIGEASKIFSQEDVGEEEEAYADFGDISGEMWIGKGTYYLRKFTVDVNYTGEYKGTTKMTASLTNFNQPMQIEAPADAVPFDQMWGGMPAVSTHTDPNCTLSFIQDVTLNANGQAAAFGTTQEMSLIAGASMSMGVTGYKGIPAQIAWRSSNRAVAEADVIQGESVNLKAQKPGQAQFTITDTAVGPECKLTVNWTTL
jgi:hypothetical protein